MLTFFSKIYDLSRSFFTVREEPQQNSLLDSLVSRVSSYEACLVDMKDLLQKQDSDNQVFKDVGLRLLNDATERFELKFATCDTKVSGLAEKLSKFAFVAQQANEDTSNLKTQVSELKNQLETIADKLHLSELHFGQQQEELLRANDLSSQEVKDLSGLLQELSDQLGQHVQRSMLFVSGLDKFLCSSNLEVSELRTETRDNRTTLQQLEKAVSQAEAFEGKRQAEMSSLLRTQSKNQEDLAERVQTLQDTVRLQKRELDNAVDIISRIDCITSASGDKDDSKWVREEVSKVGARVTRMETQVRTLLTKLTKHMEEKQQAAKAVKEAPEQSQKTGHLQQQEALMVNLQKEIEQLKKEKEELAKEVKHMKHARRNEKIGADIIERRMTGLEEASRVAHANLKQIQDSLNAVTSALLTITDENLMPQPCDAKFKNMLDLMRPVVESIGQVVDGQSAAGPLNTKLAELTQQWTHELEETVDEDFEKERARKKLVITKSNSKNALKDSVLTHFGNELCLDLAAAASECSAEVSGPQINVTRRVISSKVADEKRAAKCAGRKYTGHYAGVAPAGTETRQQADYIKMNIRNAGRPREERS